ncbi:hypothetical protein GCM10018954_045080 [Kutzneria kofuensis]
MYGDVPLVTRFDETPAGFLRDPTATEAPMKRQRKDNTKIAPTPGVKVGNTGSTTSGMSGRGPVRSVR